MHGNRLARELAALCVIKLIAIGVLYALFFGPSHRPVVEAAIHLGGPVWPAPSDQR
jgi:hypothetical protein